MASANPQLSATHVPSWEVVLDGLPVVDVVEGDAVVVPEEVVVDGGDGVGADVVEVVDDDLKVGQVWIYSTDSLTKNLPKNTSNKKKQKCCCAHFFDCYSASFSFQGYFYLCLCLYRLLTQIQNKHLAHLQTLQ